MAEIQNIKENNNNLYSDVKQCSRLSSKSFVYCWTIAEISSCLDFSSSTVSVYSPEFIFENANWRLTLEVSSKVNSFNKIKVRLCKTERGGNGYYIKYKISLFDDEGTFATKEAKSKFEGDNTVGSKVIFRKKGQKNILDGILNSDKLIVHCELSVLTAFRCTLKPCILPNTTNNSDGKVKKLKISGVDISAKMPKPKRVFAFRKTDVQERLVLLMSFVMVLLLLGKVDYTRYQNDKFNEEVNDLVVDTTLKVMKIADALNLTELKIKSRDLLTSLQKNYNVSDFRFSEKPERW